MTAGEDPSLECSRRRPPPVDDEDVCEKDGDVSAAVVVGADDD